MGLRNLVARARKLARGRERQIDRGLERAEREINKRTGGKHDRAIRSARHKVGRALADPDTDKHGDGPASRPSA